MNKKRVNKSRENLDNALDAILKSRREDIYAIFYEAIEDYVMGKEIEKGLESGIANKNEVYRLLRKHGNRIHKIVQG